MTAGLSFEVVRLLLPPLPSLLSDPFQNIPFASKPMRSAFTLDSIGGGSALATSVIPE